MPEHLALLLAAAFAAAVAIVIVLLPPFRRRIDREYRHSRALQRAIMLIGAFLLAVSAACIVLGHPSGSLLFDLVLVGMFALLAAVITASFLRRRPTVTIRPRRILAIGAHPDDLELACGATLAKLVDEGHEVVTMVMSAGSVGGNRAVRIGEARRGSEFLGASATSVKDHPDTRLQLNERGLVHDIEEIIKDFRPDVVLTHSANDYHQDHSAVHFATMRAARNLSSILCFESPSSTRLFNPGFFVDVADHVEIKVRAVELHHDQHEKPYMSGERVRAAAAFRGAQAKVRFAEGFEVMRLQSASVGDF